MKLENIIDDEYLNLSKKIRDVIANNPYSIEKIMDQNEEHILDIYSNNNKILSVKYEISGLYNYQSNTFYWGNSLLPTNKKINRLVKKIKKSKKDIKNMIKNKEYSDIGYLERMLYYVSNNIFYIEQNNIIDLIKFSCYIAKNLGVLVEDTLINGKKYAIYYFIVKIISM